MGWHERLRADAATRSRHGRGRSLLYRIAPLLDGRVWPRRGVGVPPWSLHDEVMSSQPEPSRVCTRTGYSAVRVVRVCVLGVSAPRMLPKV